jgi:galactokinase
VNSELKGVAAAEADKQNPHKIIGAMQAGRADGLLESLYGSSCSPARQTARYEILLSRFADRFGAGCAEHARLFSAPGRTELGGNHTDHNCGKVLAAAVSIDMLCAACASEDMQVVIDSEGFAPVAVDLHRVGNGPDARFFSTTDALVLGVAEAFQERGLRIGGFRAAVLSDIKQGSGLSSSAAAELIIGSIFSVFYNGGSVDSLSLARFGQAAENRWFHKPSGLMDQTACAVGGIIGIDFRIPDQPLIIPVLFSFLRYGLTLAVVDTGGSHADLTPCYAGVVEDMGKAAAFFSVACCRDITLQQLLDNAGPLRKEAGDRSLLRAYHFLKENERVDAMMESLADGDVMRYLTLVKASGSSSFRFLQNMYPDDDPGRQGLSTAIALTEEFLGGEGACRVQGGGFAGTIQAYIPNDRIEEYRSLMEGVFSPGCVRSLSIRTRPAGLITL